MGDDDDRPPTGARSFSNTQGDGLVKTFRSIFPRHPPANSGLTIMPAQKSSPSLGTVLSLVNNRKLALLQSRVDRHEVELHDLQIQIDLQRQVIMRLITWGRQLRTRLGVGEAAYARLLGLTKVLVLELHIVQMHLRRDKAIKETLWRLQLNQLWQMRGKLLRIILLILLCHGALKWSQIYSLQSTISSLLLGSFLPPSTVRKAGIISNSVILFGSSLICQNFYEEVRSSFPFNWLLSQ